METQVIVRVDSELQKRADRFAKAEGKTVSLVVKELLEGYGKSRDMSLYIGELWDRIGSRLKMAGSTQNDVENVIREAKEKAYRGYTERHLTQ